MNDITGHVKAIIEAIEGKPLGKEMLETPGRVQRAYEEMFDGYNVDTGSLFKVSEGTGNDQIVTVNDIEFVSWCRHHFLPWQGVAHVAYLPTERVIGVSKVGRLVLAYAHRLTLQEELTKQIAYSLMNNLKPKGVAVIVVGEHFCMRYRGVKLPTSQVRSSEMIGEFRENSAQRMEVLSLLGLK